MKKILPIALVLCLPVLAQAETSAELELVSDYRSNGVSYSDRNPALQASLTYTHDSGFYVGNWLTNVDYGSEDPTKAEWQIYVGYGQDLTENLALDVQASQYVYLGESEASEGNYQEYSLALIAYENTELRGTYAPDYFGADAYNAIIALSHDIALSEDYNLNLTASHTKSDAYPWEETGSSYQAVEATLSRAWQGFDFRLTGSMTSLDGTGEDGKSSLVVGVKKSWDW